MYKEFLYYFFLSIKNNIIATRKDIFLLKILIYANIIYNVTWGSKKVPYFINNKIFIHKDLVCVKI